MGRTFKGSGDAGAAGCCGGGVGVGDEPPTDLDEAGALTPEMARMAECTGRGETSTGAVLTATPGGAARGTSAGSVSELSFALAATTPASGGRVR